MKVGPFGSLVNVQGSGDKTENADVQVGPWGSIYGGRFGGR